MTPFHPAAARLAGRALAIAPRALDALLTSNLPVGARDAVIPILEQVSGLPRGYTLTETGIAVVPVIGPLVARADWLTALFGAMSYGEIGHAVENAAADPAVRAILLEIDSPGGEVGGLFDLVDRIATIRDNTGKPLWAAASESALSAAYAIACAATRIYVTRTAEVGSVGVVAVHIDESAADAIAGLKWTLIHAGAKKVNGNPHEPLSGSAFTDVQTDVDALHADLVDLVACNRDLTPEAVRATEAAVYRGQRGIDIGFADRLGTVEQALTDLVSELDAPRPEVTAPRRVRAISLQPARSTSMDQTEELIGGKSADTAETANDPPAAPAVPDPAPNLTPATTTSTVDALRAEFAEITEIAAQATRLGVPFDAAEAIRKVLKPDALRRSLLDALAARSEASAVVAAAPLPATAGDSPIVRRARERAAATRT